MRDFGKHSVLGVQVDALDYEAATAKILSAAREGRGFAATALAVHGVMTGVGGNSHRYRLNNLDLVTPDGQPVRWALNLLYGTQLTDRVYGPKLTLQLCAAAAAEELPVFFYGSTPEVLSRLTENLKRRYPGLTVAGSAPSKFRTTTSEEKEEIARHIRGSGAKIVFVGLGCPRQEVFAYEYRESLGVPVVAVGAAFDYHAGLLREPPMWVQRNGLQWLYRLTQTPRRRWKRYLLLNTSFSLLLALQLVHLWRPNGESATPPESEVLYG